MPGLEGRINLKIPNETQTGKLFRLRGKGVKSVRGGERGDLLCRVIVETPVNLNRKQKDLLKEFEESLHKNERKHRPKEFGWVDNVKRFFEGLK